MVSPGKPHALKIRQLTVQGASLQSMSSGRSLRRFRRQFAVIQFPIADLRVLAAEDTGRLSKPSWPDPVAGDEFLRGAGEVQDRPRGPIRDWSGERAFCDASGLVRFPEPHTRRASRPTASLVGYPDDPFTAIMVIPRYRRVYSDGLSVRIDVAMTLRWWYPAWIDASRTDLDCLSVPVSLPWLKSGEVPLASIGAQLARRFAEITTRHGSSVRYDLVRAGTPMLLTERHTDNGVPPSSCSADGVRFDCRPVVYLKRRIPAWSLTFSPHCDGARARQIRGMLWRLHTERESLRATIRVWRQNGAVLDRDRLRDYLAEQLKILNRERRAGVPQTPLLKVAQQIESLAPPEVIDDLRAEIRRESLGILRSLDRVIERTIGFDYATPLSPGLRIHVEHGGHITMSTGDTYNVHGGAIGSAFGPGAQTHNENFMITPLAVEELHRLSDRVRELADHLPPDQQQELTQAHQELEQAVSANDHQHGRIRASAERLMRVATSVGTVGAPLVEAVANLLKAAGLA